MIEKDELIREALAARGKAYVPYSQFQVGAALATRDGKVYHGCNVENASFGLTNCAERTAIFKAISEGATEITQVVVYTPTGEPTTPCGACRQVIREFGKNAKCVSICDSEQRLETTLEALLPQSFGPEYL